MNGEAEDLGFVMVLFLVICVFTVTLDGCALDLKTIQSMSSNCKDNGGLKRIEHDYDVVCNNGAEFSYDRTK